MTQEIQPRGWAWPLQWWWELAGELLHILADQEAECLDRNSLGRSREFRVEAGPEGRGSIPERPAPCLASICHTSHPRSSRTSQDKITSQGAVFRHWEL